MGLIHWWPLNGDKNDHAGNLDLTSSSSTFVEGKINQALQLNGVIAKVANPFIGLNDWSISFWLKDNGSSAWSDFICFSKNLIRLELDNASNWCWYTGNAGTGETFPATGNLFGSGTILNSGASANTWYHVTIVKKNTNAKFYLDGVLKNTSASATNFTSESATMYFNSRANETTSSKMSLCDVRCYDHVLSEAEIHELKSGLLIHYNFENYIGNIDYVTALSEWQSYIDGSGQNAVGTKTAQADGSILIKSINQNARLRWQKYIAITKGERYTLSIKYKQVSGDQTFRWQVQERSTEGGGSVYYTHWSTSGHKEKTIEDRWKIISFSFVVQNTGYFMIWLQEGADYQTYNQEYYLKDFSVCKYETEYDCSGNENHATVNGVDIRDGAATGAHSAYFLNGEQWLEHTETSFSASTLSIAFWWKSSCTAAKTGYHIPFAIDSGRVEISIPNNGQLRWGGYINGSRYCNNVTCVDANGATFSLNNGKWHHIVSVFDGTGFLGYVDGVYQGKQGSSGTISYTSKILRIGKYNSPASSDYGATDAYISDVRVYNTTLSTDDITRLYKHTVKITPEQNLIGDCFIEKGDQENINFLSTPYKTGGWGGNTAVDGNELVLTAINGWHSFVSLTPERFKTKNAVLSFEYCFTNKDGLADGVWIHTTSSTAQYLIGSGPKVYDTAIGVWTSISLPLTNLTDYIGWTLRGSDGKGKYIVMRIRNPRLLVDKINTKVQPTGVVECNGINQIENVRIESHGLVTANDFIEQ